MTTNFKLIIEYDGSAYHGWQRQNNDLTIQSEIEKALATMMGKHIPLTGSGRTDAGVHSFGQTANFHCDTQHTAEIFVKALNSILPQDIVIINCALVDDDFHARFHVKSKVYQYRILNRTIPAAIYRQYAWHIRKKLDLSPMQIAGKHLVGTHDFKAFQGQGSIVNTTVRRIISFRLYREKDMVMLEIEGDGFLRFMVRNIVGTIVNVGTGKITPDDFKRILDSRDRSQAGITAPPQGLFLMKVRY